MNYTFDIFKRLQDGNFFWIAADRDFDSARQHLDRLSAVATGREELRLSLLSRRCCSFFLLGRQGSLSLARSDGLARNAHRAIDNRG